MSQEKLIQAIWANNIDEVKKLIENHEADPNQPARFGDTPLHGACRGDHIEIAQFLIENGANPNQPDESGETPLHYACERGHREIAKLLIENGVNVNYNDNYGKTPLYSACYQGYTEIAEFLIKHGANVNQLDNWGRTPLHFPSFWGHTEIAKLLMEHGANVNATDFSGKTPLHNACTLSKEEWREFLIENGAKVSDYMVSGAYNIPETMPHIRAAQWCQDALAEEPVYGVMPEGVNLELLQKVMKGQLVEEGSIDKLNAFAVADNPITNQIKAGTFIEDTTNAILEKYAKRLYKNILSGTPHDVETLDTLPQEMQEFVVEKVKELCLENGIVSYENAKTALNSVNIPYYMREEMRKTLDESRSIFEVIEGGVLGSVYDQTPVPKDLLTKYQDNAHPYDPSTDKRKTLLDLKSEEMGPLEAEQLSLLMDNPNLILPKAVKNHLNELGVKEKAEAYHNYAATIIQKAFRSQDKKKVQRIIRANTADRRVKLNQSKGPVEETKGEFNILASNEDHSATTIGRASQTPETKKAPEEKSPL